LVEIESNSDQSFTSEADVKTHMKLKDQLLEDYVLRGQFDDRIPALVLMDLFDVGPSKPLGYLPIETIKQYGQTPESMTAEAERKGLCHELIGDHLYFYEEASLQSLLDENRNVLEEAGWPISVSEFVVKVETELADSKTPLFRLIARAFADERNSAE